VSFLNLVGVEWLRLWSRRLVKLALTFVLLLFLAINIGDFVTKDASASAAQRRAERAAAQALEQCRDFQRQFELDRDAGHVPPDATAPECSPEGFAAQNFLQDRRYVMAGSARDDLVGAVVSVSVVAFVVGASFAGAEWAAGTMAALLFWEPRRLRVLLAKIAALGSAAYATGVALGLLQLGASFVKAEFRGTFAGLPDGFYGDLLVDLARAPLLAVFTALLAFGIASLTRVTTAALAVAFGYFAILENVMRVFRPSWARFLLGEQFSAFVEGKIEILSSRSGAFDGLGQPDLFVLHRDRAALTLAVYLTIVLGLALASFASRDVT
jgi:hypothetical protein